MNIVMVFKNYFITATKIYNYHIKGKNTEFVLYALYTYTAIFIPYIHKTKILILCNKDLLEPKKL